MGLMNNHITHVFMRTAVLFLIIGLFPLFHSPGLSARNHPADTSLTLSLSLGQARDYALENSYGMRRAQADLSIAGKQIRETTATGLPQISASVGYNYYLDIPTSLVPAEFFGGEPGEFEEIRFGTEHNLTATASVNQLIFDGQYIVGLRAARIYRDLARQRIQRSQLEIRNTVTETYLLVLLAHENQDIVRQNLRNMEQMLYETQQMKQEGLTDPINADQLQLVVSIIGNRLAALERQYKITLDLLKFQIGMELDRPLLLTDQLEELHSRSTGILEAETLFDHEYHVDYRIARLQENMRLMELRREQSAFLPSLSASFVRQEMAMRDAFDFFDSQRPWFPSTYFAVNLNIPVFSSGLRSSRTQQARLELEKSHIAREEMRNALLLQKEEALANYRTAREQYQGEKSNLELAERIYQRTRIMYTEGMATSLELTQANEQLLTTQANYYSSVFNVLNAQNDIERALGRLEGSF